MISETTSVFNANPISKPIKQASANSRTPTAESKESKGAKNASEISTSIRPGSVSLYQQTVKQHRQMVSVMSVKMALKLPTDFVRNLSSESKSTQHQPIQGILKTGIQTVSPTKMKNAKNALTISSPMTKTNVSQSVFTAKEATLEEDALTATQVIL